MPVEAEPARAPEAARPVARPARGWPLALAVYGPLLVAVAGLISGRRTLFYRDIFNVHLPAKLSQLRAWREGYLPAIDPLRAGGQPSSGNLNSLPFYPDNLLYLVSPELWAFNAHFWLHLLLAPLGCLWLGRVWGLGRSASWTLAATYVTAGAYLSQLGFYNLVPAASLAPGFVAASIVACRGLTAPSPDDTATSGRGRAGVHETRALVVVGIGWALLLLGGDPILALQILVLGGLAVIVDQREAPSRRWTPLAVLTLAGILGCGVLLALPQLVELGRIVGTSYRGFVGYEDRGILVGSWDPRQILEALVPFAFGRSAEDFWAFQLFDGERPLYLSLFPGVLTLALVVAAGRPRTRAGWFGWLVLAGGVFVALGQHNPVIRALAHLPGADLLRFPVKAFLAVTLGSSCLAALGMERLAARSGTRTVLRSLAVVLLAYLALVAVLLEGRGLIDDWLRGLLPEGWGESQLHAIQADWLRSAVLMVLLLLAYVVIVLCLRRRRSWMVAALLAAHTATQLVVLHPLMPTDEAAAYRELPPVARFVEGGETLVQGSYANLFPGAESFSGGDASPRGVQRRVWRELYPQVGARMGQEYELNVSPEGLDSFLTHLVVRLMRGLEDADRLRLLEALGVDLLVLPRPLRVPDDRAPPLRTHWRSDDTELWLYEIDGAPDLVVAGSIFQAPDVNTTLRTVLDPSFDPELAAVIPGDASPVRGRPGEAEWIEEGPERLRVRVRASTRSVLVIQRAYLPLYKARVDGEPVTPTTANLDRLAVVVPAGEHDVEVWIDRTPLHLALAGLPLGIFGLWWLVGAATRKRPGPAAGHSGEATGE